MILSPQAKEPREASIERPDQGFLLERLEVGSRPEHQGILAGRLRLGMLKS